MTSGSVPANHSSTVLGLYGGRGWLSLPKALRRKNQITKGLLAESSQEMTYGTFWRSALQLGLPAGTHLLLGSIGNALRSS